MDSKGGQTAYSTDWERRQKEYQNAPRYNDKGSIVAEVREFGMLTKIFDKKHIDRFTRKELFDIASYFQHISDQFYAFQKKDLDSTINVPQNTIDEEKRQKVENEKLFDVLKMLNNFDYHQFLINFTIKNLEYSYSLGFKRMDCKKLHIEHDNKSCLKICSILGEWLSLSYKQKKELAEYINVSNFYSETSCEIDENGLNKIFLLKLFYFCKEKICTGFYGIINNELREIEKKNGAIDLKKRKYLIQRIINDIAVIYFRKCLEVSLYQLDKENFYNFKKKCDARNQYYASCQDIYDEVNARLLEKIVKDANIKHVINRYENQQDVYGDEQTYRMVLNPDLKCEYPSIKNQQYELNGLITKIKGVDVENGGQNNQSYLESVRDYFGLSNFNLTGYLSLPTRNQNQASDPENANNNPNAADAQHQPIRTNLTKFTELFKSKPKGPVEKTN